MVPLPRAVMPPDIPFTVVFCSEDIQRPVVNVILLKMGLNRNMARNVVFGTCKYGCLGVDHLATGQGFAQLQYLIEIL
jgi:hypothetical protein